MFGPPRELAKLPRLIQLARLGAARPDTRKEAATIAIPEPSFEVKYAPYGLFNSSYEVYIWRWLNERGYQRVHQWEPQVTFGGRGQRGSTRVDFISNVLMIAFYPDGSYWHESAAHTAKDQMLRAQVKGQGYRVVQWLIDSSDMLVRELPLFYRRMVYGGF